MELKKEYPKINWEIEPVEMSDEEYEHRINQIFELFGNTKTPHERFYHSMNMGCFE